MSKDVAEAALFVNLPQPPARPEGEVGQGHITSGLEDNYLRKLEKYIDDLSDYIRSVQEEEGALLEDFQGKLDTLTELPPASRAGRESAYFDVFRESQEAIRERRRLYRSMLADAMAQRSRLLDSMIYEQEEVEHLRSKLYKLRALPDDAEVNAAGSGLTVFSIVVLIFQVLLIVAFALVSKFPHADELVANSGSNSFPVATGNLGPLIGGTGPTSAGGNNTGSLGPIFGAGGIDTMFALYTDTALFVLLGFGLLYSFLRKYAYSALGYTFIIVAFAAQWSILVVEFVRMIEQGRYYEFDFTVTHLVYGLFGALTVVITFGVLAGKITPFGVFALMFYEVFFYGLNFFICNEVIRADDFGQSMYTHLFGALFGLSASLFASRAHHEAVGGRSAEETSSYSSDTFAILGTLLLWVLWPSANVAAVSSAAVANAGQTLADIAASNSTGSEAVVLSVAAAMTPRGGAFARAGINTMLSLATSAVFAFLVSRTFRARRFNMQDVQMGSIAGGVAISSVLMVTVIPGAAMLIGAVAGTMAVLGIAFVQPWLASPKRRWFRVHDTRGILHVHGIPAIIAAVGGMVSTSIVHRDGGVFGQSFDELFREGDDQAALQLGALAVTSSIALVSGLLFGVLANLLFRPDPVEFSFFSDEDDWNVPKDFELTQPPVPAGLGVEMEELEDD